MGMVSGFPEIIYSFTSVVLRLLPATTNVVSAIINWLQCLFSELGSLNLDLDFYGSNHQFNIRGVPSPQKLGG